MKAKIGFLVFFLLMPTAALGHLSRCSWDPGCICIDWSFEDGSVVEVRCPGGGGGSGWVNPAIGNPGPGNPPDIIDDGSGSFIGNGQFGGPTVLQGTSPTSNMVRVVSLGKERALNRLSQLATCRDMFANSPLTENPSWLLGKIQFRDGSTIPNGKCDDVDVDTPAWTYKGVHSIQVFLCNEFEFLSRDQAALTILHELLHVAGQDESSVHLGVGPGSPPSSILITERLQDACGIQWW